MSSSLVRTYLKLLPIFSLIAIILSTTRIVFSQSYVQAYLLVLFLFELLILIVYYRQVIKNKYVCIFFFLLLPSLLIGLLNNEISRRHITDFLIPMLFVAKVAVFSRVWCREDISEFFKYYSKVTLVFSSILIVFVYGVFMSEGASRISIFPPLELTSVFYIYNNVPAFLLCVVLIFLYGKRAQLISLILVSILSLINLGMKSKVIIFTLASFLTIGMVHFIAENPDNMSVRRFTYTIEKMDFSSVDSVNSLSAGRFDEVLTILDDMETMSIFFGIGMGYSYELYTESGELKQAANAHFTPLGLLSKYGIFFTVFLYSFIINNIYYAIFRSNIKSVNIAGYVVLFVLIESMFSYSLFVTSINSVLIGFIISVRNKV